MANIVMTLMNVSFRSPAIDMLCVRTVWVLIAVRVGTAIKETASYAFPTIRWIHVRAILVMNTPHVVPVEITLSVSAMKVMVAMALFVQI